MDDDADPEDILFLALLRPAMMFGVPATGCLLNVSGSLIVGAWLGVGTWHILIYWLVLLPSIHFAMRAAVAKDYHRFRTMTLWIATKGRAHATHLWGGATLAPLPGWPRAARELAVSV